MTWLVPCFGTEHLSPIMLHFGYVKEGARMYTTGITSNQFDGPGRTRTVTYADDVLTGRQGNDQIFFRWVYDNDISNPDPECS